MIEYFYDVFFKQYAELLHENDLFFNSPFYHGTSMLMGSIQIVIRQML